MGYDRFVTRPARTRRRKATDAGALVAGVLSRYGILDTVRELRLVTSWPDVVGERIAARSQPDGLQGGVLHVRVANSAWVHELTFLREDIRARANAAVGDPPLVREVRFHVGRARHPEDPDDVIAALARRPRRQTARPTPPDPEVRAAVQAIIERLRPERDGEDDPDDGPETGRGAGRAEAGRARDAGASDPGSGPRSRPGADRR